eukprot:3939215-Rhodomonas_salina.3
MNFFIASRSSSPTEIVAAGCRSVSFGAADSILLTGEAKAGGGWFLGRAGSRVGLMGPGLLALGP